MTYRRNAELFEPLRTIQGSRPSELVMDTKDKLRNEYRKTWEAFSRQMKTAQELAGVGEAGAADKAIREADIAMAAHQDARNKLAAVLAPNLAEPRPIAGTWQCTDKRQVCNSVARR